MVQLLKKISYIEKKISFDYVLHINKYAQIYAIRKAYTIHHHKQSKLVSVACHLLAPS